MSTVTAVKILHFADLHLGFRFRGLGAGTTLSRTGDLKRTFSDIISLAGKEQVELLLIAGDLFESWEAGREEYQFVFDAFSSIPDTTIALVAGNHDPLTPDSLYLTKEWPDNVIIFSKEYDSVVLEDLGVELWGASFSSPYRHQSQLTAKEPKRSDLIQIGLLHGTVGSAGLQTEYHPITTQQIAASGLDYLAVGHTHKPSQVLKEGGTYYAYSGSPEGMGFDELGERGVYLGTVGKNHCQLTFTPMAQRLFLEPSVDISGVTTAHEAAEKIKASLLAQYGEDMEEHLYKILLTGSIADGVGLNLENITGLLGQLFYVKLRDHTEIDVDIERVAKERTLRGVFVSKLLEQQESATAEEQNAYQIALKLGLKSFYGEVDYYEN